MKRRITAGLIVALLLSLIPIGSAWAHAKLVSSTPAAGAKLAAAPGAVMLKFSEEISAKESESFFIVTDAQGAEVSRGKLDTNDVDHLTLSGALKPALADGVYTVTWQAVTPDDNGKSEGSFSFGINKDPGAQPTAAPEHDETAEPTTAAASGAAKPTAAAGASASQPANLPKTGAGQPSGLIYLLAGGMVLALGGLALLRARRRERYSKEPE